MRATEIRELRRTPLFRVGIALQFISGALIALILFAIRLGLIDYMELAFETPFDKRSPRLDALHWGMFLPILAFSSGWAFYAAAFLKLRNRQSKPPTEGKRG